MNKFYCIILIIGLWIPIGLNGQNWKNLVPNYSFESNNFNLVQYSNYDRSTKITSDTSRNNKRLITHGLFLKGIFIPRFYAIGYEYENRLNKNAFGIKIGIACNRLFNVASNKHYANFYLGFTPFYEYGKRWGFHVGLQSGIAINPIIYSDKLFHIAPADRPYKMAIAEMLDLGIFYRTKNNRWKFMLSLVCGVVWELRESINFSTPFVTSNTGFKTQALWRINAPTVPLPRITIVYNLKIQTK